jgi:hypothetical protein
MLVCLDQEYAQACIQLGQREHGFGRSGTRRRVPRLVAQEELIDSPKDALDLASPARLASDREHQGDVQIGGNLLEVVRGEVAAVVGVERVRDAAHRPVRIPLAPDRLPQRERGLN